MNIFVIIILGMQLSLPENSELPYGYQYETIFDTEDASINRIISISKVWS